jgi:hypothetical protein
MEQIPPCVSNNTLERQENPLILWNKGLQLVLTQYQINTAHFFQSYFLTTNFNTILSIHAQTFHMDIYLQIYPPMGCMQFSVLPYVPCIYVTNVIGNQYDSEN